MPGTGNSTKGIIAGSEALLPKKLFLHPLNPPNKKMKLTMAKNLTVVNKQPGVITANNAKRLALLQQRTHVFFYKKKREFGHRRTAHLPAKLPYP